MIIPDDHETPQLGSFGDVCRSKDSCVAARRDFNFVMTQARILFVDDSLPMRLRYEALLRQHGFAVETTGDASWALQLLTPPDHGFHLVISDLYMPEMDGRALVEGLRKLPHNKMLPVLVLTGSPDWEDVVPSLEAGASDYVLKERQEHDPQWQGELLARVKNHAQTGLLAEQLDRMSRTDGLTDLFNRRHGTQRLDEEIFRSRRYGRGLAVCLMDIDHFKKVNDTHGHQAGDDVLVEVARRLAEMSRESDCVIRWGGEEFLVLFPETEMEEAAGIVERFRKELGGTPIWVNRQLFPLEVTVSGGVAVLEAQDTAESLVARADSALYKAKESGRNKLLLAQFGEVMPIQA